ncbi:hypothetical protein TGDOM2_399850, partial [Toxoplasma gondii GAB2-2007-GAL-DOM2]
VYGTQRGVSLTFLHELQLLHKRSIVFISISLAGTSQPHFLAHAQFDFPLFDVASLPHLCLLPCAFFLLLRGRLRDLQALFFLLFLPPFHACVLDGLQSLEQSRYAPVIRTHQWFPQIQFLFESLAFHLHASARVEPRNSPYTPTSVHSAGRGADSSATAEPPTSSEDTQEKTNNPPGETKEKEDSSCGKQKEEEGDSSGNKKEEKAAEGEETQKEKPSESEKEEKAAEGEETQKEKPSESEKEEKAAEGEETQKEKPSESEKEEKAAEGEETQKEKPS